jgi:hypothetical protein
MKWFENVKIKLLEETNDFFLSVFTDDTTDEVSKNQSSLGIRLSG